MIAKACGERATLALSQSTTRRKWIPPERRDPPSSIGFGPVTLTLDGKHLLLWFDGEATKYAGSHLQLSHKMRVVHNSPFGHGWETYDWSGFTTYWLKADWKSWGNTVSGTLLNRSSHGSGNISNGPTTHVYQHFIPCALSQPGLCLPVHVCLLGGRYQSGPRVYVCSVFQMQRLTLTNCFSSYCQIEKWEALLMIQFTITIIITEGCLCDREETR